MSWLEEKYIRLYSSSVRNFKQKSSKVFTFSCPICGDSEKNPLKTRGFFYKRGSDWNFFCHNCDASSSFYTFLKNQNPTLYQGYVFEKYKEKSNNTSVESEPIEDLFEVRVNRRISDFAKRIDLLGNDHIAKVYLRQRRIPEIFFDKLYYTFNMNDIKNIFTEYDDVKLRKNEDRILIPILDTQKELIGLSARAIADDVNLRYMNLRISGNKPLIYGLDRLNFGKTKYVLEGPFDSMFIENSVAALGSDLLKCIDILDNNTVYIFDNQPRNKSVVNMMKKVAGLGKKIVVWPDNLPYKDINLMAQNNVDFKTIINNSTHQKLSAMLQIGKWSKV